MGSKVTLIPERHILVQNEQDENGNWLVMDVEEKNMFYVAPTPEVLDFFQLGEPLRHEQDNVELLDEATNNVPENTVYMNENNAAIVGKWSRRSILLLIQFFKENYVKMSGTSVKNATVWKEITDCINNEGFSYTKKQVENKFKYLKQKYMKKKDSMGNRNTGGSPVVFDYFDEFNDIFGEKPSATPCAIASSSRDGNLEECREPQKKKIKPTRAEKQITSWSKEFKERDQEKEEAKERRHKERMEVTQKAILSYENMMQKLIDKF